MSYYFFYQLAEIGQVFCFGKLNIPKAVQFSLFDFTNTFYFSQPLKTEGNKER